MASRRLTFRVHAVQRMAQPDIREQDVHQIVETGEMIQDYAQDQPYPSRLLLGWIGMRPIHLVVADNQPDEETIIITVYEPDPNLWDPTLRIRRGP